MGSVDGMTYLQPHESITGTRRADDSLLTFAGSDVALRIMGQVWSAVAVGNPVPLVERMYDRNSEPVAGDPVAISDAIYSRDEDTRNKAVGYLIEQRREWWTTDEQWEAERYEDGTLTESDRPVDTAWYVQYGPNPDDVCRWTNCRPLAIPPFPAALEGYPEGNKNA